MNAVVYARFSSHRQGEQSIEGQVAEAERFAASHGLTIVKVYADRAQTGRNDNREQFQLMLADAAKHAFDALIVWKTDRIGRNKEEIALNKYHLKKNGVKIYYVAEAIPDTPEGIILEAVIEGMAAYYSEQLSQNVRRGMKNSAQKGRYTGGTCPLGYTINADKKYEVDPKYAPVVRDIFQLYSEGKTITEIVKILNDKGLRTSRGHPFTHNSLRTVLKNKKYIGTYEYNGEVSIENSVPPIFNESTKERMNELEEQKKDLRLALAAAKLKEDLALKKEHIVFFLHQFAGMDYSDIDCQKRLIKIFLNSVFVYDDKVVLTFNYSGDDRTITLHEIDGGLGHSICIPSAVVHQKKRLA